MVCQEREPLRQPAADGGERLGRDAVTDRVAARDCGRPRLAEQVRPGAVEQIARDDRVLLALGDDDGHPGEAGRCCLDAGFERQRAVQDGAAGVAVRVVEQQSAGERRAATDH